jgi:hypothetical protein
VATLVAFLNSAVFPPVTPGMPQLQHVVAISTTFPQSVITTFRRVITDFRQAA